MPGDLGVAGLQRGALVVAAPSLLDPNFARTVVLLLEHGGEGALGLVLNRRTDVPVPDALAAWAALAGDPPGLYLGGPVGAGVTAVALARTADGAAVDPSGGEGWSPVLGPVAVVDLGRPPGEVDGVEEVRMFSGYAGWSAGQLEAEVEEGSWLVLAARPDDALCRRPERLWRDVLRRQGGRTAWLANHPLDPSLN